MFLVPSLQHSLLYGIFLREPVQDRHIVLVFIDDFPNSSQVPGDAIHPHGEFLGVTPTKLRHSSIAATLFVERRRCTGRRSPRRSNLFWRTVFKSVVVLNIVVVGEMGRSFVTTGRMVMMRCPSAISEIKEKRKKKKCV